MCGLDSCAWLLSLYRLSFSALLVLGTLSQMLGFGVIMCVRCLSGVQIGYNLFPLLGLGLLLDGFPLGDFVIDN